MAAVKALPLLRSLLPAPRDPAPGRGQFGVYLDVGYTFPRTPPHEWTPSVRFAALLVPAFRRQEKRS